METNSYSRRWFDVFETTHPYTDDEIGFLVRQLPNPPYRRILDVCCGRGRHALRLARLGYEVVGVDRDADAIRRARQAAADAAVERLTFVRDDARNVAALPGAFDAVIILWQSFGFFQPAENVQLLSDIAGKLTPNGKVVLDLYNVDWWRAHQGTGTTERGGRTVRSTSTLSGSRLRVTLSYDGEDATDDFDWQLFSADQIRQVGERVGLHTSLVCTEFREAKPLSDRDKVMQVVLERRSVTATERARRAR